MLEILNERPQGKIKAAIFDFDGTLSSFRHGWEQVMEQVMNNSIVGTVEHNDTELKEKITNYISDSTGIQTIYQIEWLVEQVKLYGKEQVLDVWEYKDIFNDKLMEMVKKRTELVLNNKVPKENFRIKGALEFIQSLKNKNICLYLASGSDEDGVKSELKALELNDFFVNTAGALHRQKNNPKQATAELALNDGFKANEIIFIGDGKVEIELGVKLGSTTLALATEEPEQTKLNNEKLIRLKKAKPNAIAPHFLPIDKILEWMEL